MAHDDQSRIKITKIKCFFMAEFAIVLITKIIFKTLRTKIAKLKSFLKIESFKKRY